MARYELKTGRVVHTGMTPGGTPRNRLHAAAPFRRSAAAPPAQSFVTNGTPAQMDGNDNWGDCTCACLGNILDVIKRIFNYSGGPIPDANVLTWAKGGGFENGAVIADVLDRLTTVPMIDQNGQANLIGPALGVNYGDMPTVYDALSQHQALDLGVDARPWLNCVGNSPVAVMQLDPVTYANYDHSIPLFADWGTAGYLAEQYSKALSYNVQLGNLPADTPCIGSETWGVYVITPVQNFQRSTGESWAIQSYPAPSPAPAPPGPGPGPGPGPINPPRPTRRAAGLLLQAAELFVESADRHDSDPRASDFLLDELEAFFRSLKGG